MRKRVQGLAFSTALTIFSFGSSAKAALIYVSTINQLQTIDTTTQATTLIGNTGVVLLDIAFSPGGTLFGVGLDSLFSVNPSTGQTTLIGDLGDGPFVNALGFDRAGVLYGAGNNTLFTINTSTGAASPVGTGAFISAGDLDFVGNTLFLTSTSPVSSLVSLDPATAAATPIGPVGFNSVFGLASGSVSTPLFGVTTDGQVLSVDTTTGAGTALFDTPLTDVF